MSMNLPAPKYERSDAIGNVRSEDCRTNRLPYRRDLFVGRHKELDEIRELITRVRDGKIERPVLEITGSVGLGKTWLLRHIANEYALGSNISKQWTGRKPFTVYVDLEKLQKWHGSEYWLYHHLLRLFINAIPDQLDSRPREFEALSDPSPDLPLTPDQLDKTLPSLRTWIDSLLPKWIPVLLFDSTEKVDPPSILNWLEQEILAHLAQKRKGLVIVAGRRPMVWREPDIRFHLNLEELGPLADEDDVWSSQPIEYQGQTIHIPRLIHQRYTFGHPGMAATLFLQLQEQGVPVTAENLDNADTKKRAVAPALICAERESLLEDVRPELHPLLRAVCTLRVFNVTSLQKFAIQFGAASYTSQSRAFFRQAIRDMIENNIVKWTASLSDYSIIPIVRRVLANAVRVTEGEENFRNRHQTAFDMYCDRLHQEPTTAPWSVPEILYHRAVLASLESQAVMGKQVKAELEKVLADPLFPRAYKTVDDLVNRLKSKDVDLVELHQDLIDLIGVQTFDEIIQILETHSQQLERE
jgi:hypothetical protein